MTGFARGTGQHGPLSWAWETKSVNGRGLDIRCRLPPGMDSLEPEARRAAAERFKRGSLVLSLRSERAASESRVEINRHALDQLLALVGELEGEVGVAPPSLDGLLGIRGVVELVGGEETPEAREGREAALIESLSATLDALLSARCEEGARIARALDGRLDEIERLTARIADGAALMPTTLRRRFEDQLKDLLQGAPPLPEERVAQEIALLVVKFDIREEVDRLRAHVAAARELLAQGGPVGRRLDFLCQEFNREANTLCSKAGDLEVTRIGLDLKAAIDQFREQVQNVE